MRRESFFVSRNNRTFLKLYRDPFDLEDELECFQRDSFNKSPASPLIGIYCDGKRAKIES